LDVVTVLVPVALIGALFVVRAKALDKIPYRNFGVAATLFLLWALVTILAVGGGAKELLTWARYTSYFLLIPAIALVTASPKDRAIVLGAVVLAGVGASLYGFYQYADPRILSDTFAVGKTISVRIFSTFDNPNFFSEFLLLSLCATLALLGEYWKRNRMAIALIALAGAVQLAAFLLTYTRGSWLALATGLFIGVLVFRPRWSLPLLGALIVVALVPGVSSRLLSVFSGDSSTMFRLGLWKAAGAAITQKPLFGGGLGDFLQIYHRTILQHPELYQGVLQFEPHNSYLQITAETGIIGGLLFICSVASLVWAGLRLSKRLKTDRRRSFQNAALLAGIVGIILNALTSDSFQHPHAIVYFFVLGGLIVGLGWGHWNPPAVFSDSKIVQKIFRASAGQQSESDNAGK